MQRKLYHLSKGEDDSPEDDYDQQALCLSCEPGKGFGCKDNFNLWFRGTPCRQGHNMEGAVLLESGSGHVHHDKRFTLGCGHGVWFNFCGSKPYSIFMPRHRTELREGTQTVKMEHRDKKYSEFLCDEQNQVQQRNNYEHVCDTDERRECV